MAAQNVEMQIWDYDAGAYADVPQADLYGARYPARVRQGRRGWTNRVEPATLTAALDNRDGSWSEWRAASTNRLRRNTPIRFGAPQPDGFIEATDRTGVVTGAQMLDTAGTSITGDIDVRVELEMVEDLPTDRIDTVVSKFDSWELSVHSFTGEPTVKFQWFDGGGFEHYEQAIGWDLNWRRMALRFTLDASTGEGTFYRSGAIGGTWEQVGDSQTSVGSTAIHDSNLNLAMLSDVVAGQVGVAGCRLYAFELRSGIDGTLVVDADLTGVTPGVSGFTDGAGNAWSVTSDARVTTNRWRFHGELADASARWSLSTRDGWAPIEAAGLQRRLRQGRGKPLQSALRRGYDRSVYSADVTNYWPMEEKGDENLTRFGAVVGSRPLARTAGTADPGGSTVFPCSDALPTMSDSAWEALTDPSDTGEWMVRMLFYAPTSLTTTTTFLEVISGADVWHLTYDGSTGDINVRGYDTSGADFENTTIAFGIEGRPVRMSFGVAENGANLDWGLSTQDLDGTVGGASDTVLSKGVPPVVLVRLCKDQDGGDLVLGHVSIEDAVRLADDLGDELSAHVGETAARRVMRLASEEGLLTRIVGDPDDGPAMGPQRPLTLAALLDECADTDLGLLFDPADQVAIGYRTGASMQAQDVAVTLDYDGQEVDGVPELDRDDRDFANDVTATNWDGSTARAELTTGELGTAEPPTGAGRYDVGFDVNVSDSGTLPSHAGARLLLATPRTPRLSKLVAGLHRPALSAAQRQAVLQLLPGDLLALVDLPALVYTDDLYQVVQGWSESFGTVERSIELNTTAGDPWRSGRVEQDGDIRYDTDSTLASAASAAATSLSVATSSGPLWTTDGADAPFDILVDGRVRLTVSAVAGSSSPQTFTVSATPRAIASGADVRLADPAYYTL